MPSPVLQCPADADDYLAFRIPCVSEAGRHYRGAVDALPEKVGCRVAGTSRVSSCRQESDAVLTPHKRHCVAGTSQQRPKSKIPTNRGRSGRHGARRMRVALGRPSVFTIHRPVFFSELGRTRLARRRPSSRAERRRPSLRLSRKMVGNRLAASRFGPVEPSRVLPRRKRAGRRLPDGRCESALKGFEAIADPRERIAGVCRRGLIETGALWRGFVVCLA